MTTQQPGTWHSDASHFRKPARRDFLYAGWLGGLGLSMGSLFRLQAAQSQTFASAPEPKAKSVIHIYLQGGFAHMDSFDPKPDAPLSTEGDSTTSRPLFLVSASVRTCRRRQKSPTN